MERFLNGLIIAVLLVATPIVVMMVIDAALTVAKIIK